MRRSNRAWLCVLALTCVLGGCGSSRLGTVRPVAVEAVDKGGPPELAGHPRDPRYGDRLLRLEFTSPIDFFEFSRSHQYNLGIDLRWCGDKNSPDISDGFSYFYMGERQVQGYVTPDPPPKPLLVAQDGKSYLYHAYMHVDQLQEIRPADKDLDVLPPYDLAAQPKDVCLRVRGGSMLGQKGLSDPAVFSVQMIEEALKRAKKP